ncbi:hypothetical protein RhiXN_00380 [Rhizoctonia solani]|uniref:Copper acquisition factor BIM1-like domain-containing protein n=1 Tax=Rhizoctonia solani TaxID=456999 RepID=A0A8H8SV63_9AGAM|nr:uncharacterized protein RhiXN_00380 [Rhizoctonia solani]QRW18974.1 hypothetical protein RhiXN_00380 [Rhizoctonia solani]
MLTALHAQRHAKLSRAATYTRFGTICITFLRIQCDHSTTPEGVRGPVSRFLRLVGQLTKLAIPSSTTPPLMNVIMFALALLSIIPSYTLAQHVHGGNADGMGGVAMIPYLHLRLAMHYSSRSGFPNHLGGGRSMCRSLCAGDIATVYICYERSHGTALETTIRRTCSRRFVLMRDTASADKESEQDTSLTGQPKYPGFSNLPYRLLFGRTNLLEGNADTAIIFWIRTDAGRHLYIQDDDDPSFRYGCYGRERCCSLYTEWPRTRGFDEDIENQFCGGFPNAGPRSSFPLGASGVVIDSTHDTANVIVLVSFDANPQNITQFSNSSNGAQLTSFVKLEKQGEACIPVNIQSLGLSNVSNGTNATIQIQYDGGDGNLYQCADVTLLSDFTAPSNVSCASSASGTTTSGGAAATSTSPSGSNGALTTQASAGLALGVAVLLAMFF